MQFIWAEPDYTMCRRIDTRDSDWTDSAGTQLAGQQDAREPEEAREEACVGSGRTDIGQGETVSSSRRCIQSPHSRPPTQAMNATLFDE
jgi:hypothetical protein